jgi:dTDP-4-dehydrorhamnose reductase
MPDIDVWGGIECTVNRVRDNWFCQMTRSGHLERPEDLDLVAQLGIRTLRYPVLWELTAPDHPARLDFRWADERMSRLRTLGIQPIVGLIHHGSGPAYTHLLDEGFPRLLGQYAGNVAARYPWAEAYTPVNEPLTTARFSALYGHWYPHSRDDRSFARALVNQCRGIVLAMRAIREVNPRARLVQTEDLGKTYSTPAMKYQADFDNERRWITWDLLTGRVGREHPLYGFLIASGIPDEELQELRDAPCPPDIVGINHYVTSNRFLDDDCTLYPAAFHGRNARQTYADVEAVRVPAPVTSWRALLQEVWSRYQRPLAITEAHLGCSVDEQVRWFHEAWISAQTARAAGIDVLGVTSWALFGSFNWNVLLTRDGTHYEPGAFDLRDGLPRPTALAEALKDLAAGKSLRDHPLLQQRGWWRRPERLLYARPVPSSADQPAVAAGERLRTT